MVTCRNILQLAQGIVTAFPVNTSSSSLDSTRLIFWAFPPTGWVKLNTNGSVFGNPGVAAIGGLIRDASGNWIKGFMGNLGICTNTITELWAIRQGLSLLWDLGERSVVIETDSQVSIDLLSYAPNPHHSDAVLINDCCALISRAWRCKIQHTLREGNKCADFLAREGHKISCNFQVLFSPPSGICTYLFTDLAGISTIRSS
ncbi:hypothetical protein L1049_020799 [Liquidambar formosana]|uniref:RNase H type-1 domain-containing protein n=1 Tax=Liquidambar formosana TaxID=63359 RepID=A0AAP0SEH2_LIQFO